MISATTIGDIAAQMREEYEKGERAVTTSMQQAGSGLKAAWRAEIMQAGLGFRLPRTIRDVVYPRGGVSMNAAALIYTTAPKLIGTFANGETIRSKNGFWLAIPTAAAGSGRGGKRITPGGWEQMTGMRLRFVYRSGRSALLVADGARLNSRGRAVMSRAKVRADGAQRGAVTAVIFTLVPQVTLKKRLNLEGHVDQWASRIPGMIVQNWP